MCRALLFFTNARTLRLSACLPCLLLIALVSSNTSAQSRRVPPRPLPSPSPTPEAAPSSETVSAKAAKIALVAVDYVPSANVAYATGYVFRSFVEQLQRTPTLAVSTAKESNRKEAIDLAKVKTDAYVVWLQMEIDLTGNDARKGNDEEKASIGPINERCLYARYIVFTPGTAKVVTQGKVYQPGVQSVCTGSASAPSPLPSGPQPRRAPLEYVLKQVGRDAAERVVQALKSPNTKLARSKQWSKL
jgi:hypothetical protein